MTGVALGRLAQVIAGQSPPSAEVEPLTDGRPFLQGNAEFGAIAPTPVHQCAGPPKACRVGDLLLSVRAPVGAMNRADQPYGIGRGLAAIRPIESDADPRFLAYAIKATLSNLISAAEGSTFTAVTAEDIKSHRLPWPGFVEQRRIADFLDDQVTRIDQARQQRTRQTELVAEFMKARLIRTMLSETGARSRLRSLFVDERLGAWGEEATGEGDVHVARVADFDRLSYRVRGVPTRRNLPTRQARPRLLQWGDVLLERSGGTGDRPVGAAVSFEPDERAATITSNFVSRLRPREGVHPRYLALVLAAMYEARVNGAYYNQTTGIQNLDSEAYLNLSVPMVDEDTQRARAMSVDASIRQTENALARLGAAVGLLEERKRSLITAAVTGGLDVSSASSRAADVVVRG